MSFIIILLIILGVLNSSLPITNDSIEIKNIVQSETGAQIVLTEETIYDLTFSAACINPVASVEQYLSFLAKYDISGYDMISDNADTTLRFSDGLSLHINNLNLSDAKISIQANGKQFIIPIECNYTSEEEQLSLLTRDYSSYDFSSKDTRAIISQEWEDVLAGSLLENDELIGFLFQAYLQGTSVYPGMSYEECVDMLQSPSSVFEFISNTESDIWVYQTVPQTEMELHFSYYFYNGKLSCVTVTLFPPNKAFYAIELGPNNYVAPMFIVKIEDTWLTHCLENI